MRYNWYPGPMVTVHWKVGEDICSYQNVGGSLRSVVQWATRAIRMGAMKAVVRKGDDTWVFEKETT